jgi:hypothetical protein
MINNTEVDYNSHQPHGINMQEAQEKLKKLKGTCSFDDGYI